MVPPLVQSVGGADCGPNTVKEILPDGDRPPDSEATTDDGGIADPAVAADGTLNSTPGDAAPTTVSGINEPHVAVAALSLESPP
jgi:hypothetical protein